MELRKILKTFKTSPISAMKIEANIQPIKIRLNQKNQKLALRIMKLDQRHSTRLRTLWNYLSGRTHGSTEITGIGSEPESMEPITEEDQFLD